MVISTNLAFFVLVILPMIVVALILLLGMTVFKNCDTPGKRFMRKLKSKYGKEEIMKEEDAILFNIDEMDGIIKLTDEGMFYKGELVKDAGEAHRRFIEWLDRAELVNKDEEGE